MIDKKLVDYFNILNDQQTALQELYEQINTFENIHFIPAVRFETALYLSWQTGTIRPDKVLEIGFGSGTSSIFIKKGSDEIKKFISLERDKNRFERGLRLFDHLSLTGIELIKTDAFHFFENQQEQFDMVFLDAVKRDYIDYLPKLLPLLSARGILICDNILFNGKILLDDPGAKYRDGVNLLRDFNQILSTEKELSTHFIPIGDGLSISVKK